MSGNIRMQLGPVQKRLKDRIIETNVLLGDGDLTRLKTVRSKLVANIHAHEELTDKLTESVPKDDVEAKVIEEKLTSCMSIHMDGKEVLQMLDDRLSEGFLRTKTPTQSEILQTEKVQYEIENLKLENELKKEQLESLRTIKRKQNLQQRKSH